MVLIALSLVTYSLMKIIAIINSSNFNDAFIMFHKKKIVSNQKSSTTTKSKQKDLQKSVGLFLKSER